MAPTPMVSPGVPSPASSSPLFCSASVAASARTIPPAAAPRSPTSAARRAPAAAAASSTTRARGASRTSTYFATCQSPRITLTQSIGTSKHLMSNAARSTQRIGKGGERISRNVLKISIQMEWSAFAKATSMRRFSGGICHALLQRPRLIPRGTVRGFQRLDEQEANAEKCPYFLNVLNALCWRNSNVSMSYTILVVLTCAYTRCTVLA